MEANKSCHLPSAGWRTRKLVVQFHPKSPRPERRGGWVGVSLGLRLKARTGAPEETGEGMGVSAQAESASPSLPFCSVWRSVDWMTVMILGGRDLLYSVYQLNADLFQKHPGTVFHQIPGYPLATWHIKLAIIEIINDVRWTKDTGTNTTSIAWPPSSLRSKHCSWGRNSLGLFSSITFHSVLHQTLANSLEATISW